MSKNQYKVTISDGCGVPIIESLCKDGLALRRALGGLEDLITAAGGSPERVREIMTHVAKTGKIPEKACYGDVLGDTLLSIKGWMRLEPNTAEPNRAEGK